MKIDFIEGYHKNNIVGEWIWFGWSRKEIPTRSEDLNYEFYTSKNLCDIFLE